ncbi:MAG: MoxR family ATPase [Herpetosiphon sp.]|nr:MoxR family ATPase [Herpetosiphon sp.]
MKHVHDIVKRIGDNVENVIIGKREAVELTLIALLCRGHVLLEDVPGVGKTTLAKAIARSIGCAFKRIQFTPDLLPTDVTGVSIFNQQTTQFEFRPGPIIANIVLADEINRATPKAQSALLESMEEGQVTVDGTTYELPDPFIVLATQNPIEYEGTFPLPEAQLDRFLIRVSLGYPSKEHELEILESQRKSHPLSALQQVVSGEELQMLQREIRDVYVDPLIKEYIVAVVSSTRHSDDVYLGASPRGSLALYRTSQAFAAIQGRDYVTPDDVKGLIVPVLGHRMIISPAARIRNVRSDEILQAVMGQVPVPGARAGRRYDRVPN